MAANNAAALAELDLFIRHVQNLTGFAKEAAPLRGFENRKAGDGLARITDNDPLRSDAALAPGIIDHRENNKGFKENTGDPIQHAFPRAVKLLLLRNNRSR